jgi:hypothetical protein
VTVSPQLRIAALCGLVVAIAAGLFAVLELGHRQSLHAAQVSVRPPQLAHRPPVRQAPTTRHPVVPRVASGLPAALRQALLRTPLVVAVVYAPNIAAEAGAVGAARTGAAEAHAGFVALDVRDAKTAEALATIFPGVADPSVLVVRRPGIIELDLSGVQDSTTVAQAALQERR